MTQITDALDNHTTLSYNSDGDLISITDAAGQTTGLTYNQYGFISEITDALNNTTRFIYDNLGNTLAITDKNGNPTQFEYDQNNRMKQMTNAQGYRTQFGYDQNGNRTSITDAHNNLTTYTYDNFNQITAITDALNQMTSFVYDIFGNLTSVTGAENNTTAKIYDNQNRVLSVTDALDQTTSYSYDANGNLNGITDANGNTTSYSYDSLDRLTLAVYPNGSYEEYTYDKAGNRLTRTDRKGQTITYTYDELNRMTAKTYPDNSQVNYTYDALGRLSAADNNANSLAYTYDALNRVTQTVQDGKTVSYTYDAMGNRTRLTYPDNSFVTYTYNALNQLEQINNASQEAIADFTYDELSRRTRLDLLNGIRTDYQYDTLHRLTSLSSVNTASLAVINDFSYTFDNIGNRLTMTTPSGVHSYDYDDVYQLTDVNYPDPLTDMTYNYDSVGNRTSTVNGDMTDYTANSLNQYTFAGDTVFTYDENGNMVVSIAPVHSPPVPPYLGGSYWYVYDYENRLVQADTPSNIVSFDYDPFGRRTAKIVNAETVKYIYDGDQVIAEYDGSDALLRKFTYGTGIDEPIVMDTETKQYYYHVDGLGSVTEMTDSDGAVAEKYSYDVYGKVRITDASDTVLAESAIGNPYFFTGRRYDADTGLYYYRARYYSAELGRFLQVDPLEYYDSMNLYQYCLNNPVNLADPLGLSRRGERGATGGSSGQDTSNKYKHCRNHPTDPTKIQCKHHQTGKWITKPKPSDWPKGNKNSRNKNNKCGENCKKVAVVVGGFGATYIIYRCVRMIPSLLFPPSIPANLAIP